MEVVGTKLIVPPQNMSRCDEHGFVVERFCKDHQEVCCKDCVSNHGDCKAVVPLREAANDSSTIIGGIDTITKDLEKLMGKFDSARSTERQSMRSVDVQGKELERRVKKFRQNVDNMLDKLEESLVNKRDELCAEEKSVLKKRIEVCDVAICNIKDSLQRAKGIQKDSDAEKTLITVSKMKNMNEKYQGVLDELKEGKGEFALKFTPNGDLVQALDCLGSINVKSTVKPTEIVDDDQKQETKLAKIKEINVTSALDTTTCTITGCAYLSDGTLVLADESNTSIKVIAKDSSDVAMVKVLEYAPWDVIPISKDEVALRSSFTKEKVDKNIHIFKLSGSIDEMSSIKVDGRPRSIAYHEGQYYVVITKKNDSFIAVYSKDGKVNKTIVPKQNILFEPQYIEFAPKQNILYISDFSKGISGVSMTGEVVFQRADSSIEEYGGITVDNRGEVFACAGKPYGIYRVTPNGSGLVPFITWNNEIDPQALTFCKKSKTFLVTCCNSGKAFVYGVLPSCDVKDFTTT